MARVTVKDLRAEARRRLLKCGNGKTISRMNKRELLEFLSCIDHPDADRLGGEASSTAQPCHKALPLASPFSAGKTANQKKVR